MNYIRLLTMFTFLSTYAADTGFLYPPYIEVPCYKNQADRESGKPSVSIVYINIDPKFTLNILQELIRDQKGNGYLMFLDTRIDNIPQKNDPIGPLIKEITVEGIYSDIQHEQFDTFVENLYFVLSNSIPKNSTPKKG